MNILFIMSDQHNARALHCYGNADILTPHLDHLAKGGVLFQNAICQSGQCRPSRYSIWTGRYARSHGLYWNSLSEDPKEQTVGKLFKAAGYVTATIGKHHMQLSPRDQHGFDVVRTGDESSFANKGSFLPIRDVHPGQATVGESDIPNDGHPAGIVTDHVLQFLRQNAHTPFCLWYSFDGPHTPICPSRPWAQQYRPDEIELAPNNSYLFDRGIPGLDHLQSKSGRLTEQLHKQVLAYYYGYVSQIDYNIGRVLDELERLGLSSSTVVIYTADHGEMMGEHGAWTKGRTGYEATIRVPLIIRFPGVVPADVKHSGLVGLVDLLPTLLDFAGLEIPENIQGQSLRPLIHDTSASWRDAIVSEIGENLNDVCLTIRGPNYKCVQYRNKGKIVFEQFFDLVRDPWEMRNEIGNQQYRQEIDKLSRRLQAWEQSTPIANALLYSIGPPPSPP